MADRNKEFPKRLTVQVTEAMDDRLEQVARGRDEAKAEVVRAALRAFLDEQEDLIGSRRHFTKAFGRRIDHVERLLTITLGISLQILHLFHERVNRKPYDLGDLLAEMIRSGVAAEDDIQLLIEHAVQSRTKPRA